MTQNSDAKQTVIYEGILETIIYNCPDTFFTVARLRSDESSPAITIVGNIAATNEGEKVRVKGYWKNHPKFGRQLSVEQFEVILPTNSEEIIEYLSTGMIKGIGPHLAKQIVAQFGEKTFEIFDHDIDKVLEVPGIGKKRHEMIVSSWKAQRALHESMLFLSNHGIRGANAVKICNHYGGNVVSILTHHPYRLAIDIDGIGFSTADQIAKKMGIPEDAPERLQAGLLHIMRMARMQGHCYLPEQKLLQNTGAMLKIDADLLVTSLEAMEKKNKILVVDDEEKPVYLKKIYFYEIQVATILQNLVQSSEKEIIEALPKSIKKIENEMDVVFVDEQRAAIKKALGQKVCIITGGPGVGKTTIVKALVQILDQQGLSIALAAPTGRAAKRLSEATGFPASTIHRLLRFNPHQRKFEYNQQNPMEIDHLIIDESSMLDIFLAFNLLSAIPELAGITFVGDSDQLPSVGAGNFLADIIQSGLLPVARLNYIFRQSQGSSIVTVAHEINSGYLPHINNQEHSDIFFLARESSMEAAQDIVDLVTQRLPKKYGFCSTDEIQVLTPMYRGAIGANNLNQLLADAVNAGGRSIGNRRFREGDKVMQVVNNYDKDVYNGDIGKIALYNKIEKIVTICFDNRYIQYAEGDLDEVVRAYAISIHKSQGSEYPAIVIPLFTEHYIMLDRNLLYTAITRGKQLVVLIGNWRALKIAVRTIKARNRYTRLATLLRGDG